MYADTAHPVTGRGSPKHVPPEFTATAVTQLQAQTLLHTQHTRVQMTALRVIDLENTHTHTLTSLCSDKAASLSPQPPNKTYVKHDVRASALAFQVFPISFCRVVPIQMLPNTPDVVPIQMFPNTPDPHPHRHCPRKPSSSSQGRGTWSLFLIPVACGLPSCLFLSSPWPVSL